MPAARLLAAAAVALAGSLAAVATARQVRRDYEDWKPVEQRSGAGAN
jgi:hypothetical protein